MSEHFLTVCMRPELLRQLTRHIVPLEMANNSSVVTEALLEDKVADFRPNVPVSMTSDVPISRTESCGIKPYKSWPKNLEQHVR